jgi:hypothetical protein
MGDGRILLNPDTTIPLIKIYRMSLISAGSISLDSTFKWLFSREDPLPIATYEVCFESSSYYCYSKQHLCSKSAHLDALFFAAESRCHTVVGNKKDFSLEELISLKCWLQVGWLSSRSKQTWVPVPERNLFKTYINMHTYIYKSTYPMFVSWILNFQVNFRKIISLEPHMKLEKLVDEVFVRICIFYMPKLSSATGQLAKKWLIFSFFLNLNC